MDPAVLTSPDGRDFAEVTLALPGGGSKLVRLPAFWAHLVDPTTIWDLENCDPVAHDGIEVFSEGTWSGGLLWDASIVATELLLQSTEWQSSVRGATCLELGSGLGLPGLACALLGAKMAVVTDRPAVARLVEDAIEINGLSDVASAVSFEWDAEGAKGLLGRIGGSFPNVIIAVSAHPPAISMHLLAGPHLQNKNVGDSPFFPRPLPSADLENNYFVPHDVFANCLRRVARSNDETSSLLPPGIPISATASLRPCLETPSCFSTFC